MAAAAYPRRTFPGIPKLKRSPVYTPWMRGYTSGSTPSEVITATWHCVQTVFPLRCPPLTESPFARDRRYPPPGGVRHHLGGHYPSFIAPTSSCVPPQSSRGLRLPPYIRASLQVAASPPLEGGGSRRYLRESFPGCLSPYPGGIRGARARFFPRIIGLPRGPRTGRLNHKQFRSATSERRGFSGWLSAIPLRSGLQVCVPPGLLPPLRPSLAAGQLWRLRSSRTHVVTFMGIEYAHRPNRAIDGRGLSPHKTRGLVGCSVG